MKKQRRRRMDDNFQLSSCMMRSIVAWGRGGSRCSTCDNGIYHGPLLGQSAPVVVQVPASFLFAPPRACIFFNSQLVCKETSLYSKTAKGHFHFHLFECIVCRLLVHNILPVPYLNNYSERQFPCRHGSSFSILDPFCCRLYPQPPMCWGFVSGWSGYQSYAS